MKPRSAEVRRARPLLGTFVEIVIRGVAAKRAERAFDAAFATIAEVQRRMNFHDPASGLSALNQRAAKEPVQVDEWTFAVLTAAAELHRVSEGRFDVAAGSAGSFGDVELGPNRAVRFHHPGVRIDLGGIAKGFAVDQAVRVLQEAGVASGLVNAGGDLRAFGNHVFNVAIRDPREPGRAFTTVPLRNRALATSAHYFSETKLGPILEPRRRRRAARVQSATVCAHSALLADALTKVVMLRGAASAPVLAHFRADALIIATSGKMRCSPHWHAALQFPS